MRLITALTLCGSTAVMLDLSACASSPKRPYGSQNGNSTASSQSLQCQMAQANNTPPPVGCPQNTSTTGSSTAARRGSVITSPVQELPALSLPPMPSLGRLR